MMYSPQWQVGLDIENSSTLRAVSVIKRYGSWHFCDSWEIPLPVGVLKYGCIQQAKILQEILKKWRYQLPKKIDLRIALPARNIVQLSLPIPDKGLQEPELSQFIYAFAAKQLSINSQFLAIDYRVLSNELRVTVAQLTEILSWQECLQSIDLKLRVIDATPYILRNIARAAGLKSQYGLLHRLSYEWLWVSLDSSLRYITFDLAEDKTAQHVLEKLPTLMSFDGVVTPYYSSVIDEPVPNGMLTWSPFIIFPHQQIPLAKLSAAFAIACGLALRKEDRDVLSS